MSEACASCRSTRCRALAAWLLLPARRQQLVEDSIALHAEPGSVGRYLDLSNSVFGAEASTEGQRVLEMPSLQLCLLKVPQGMAASIAGASPKVDALAISLLVRALMTWAR